jgi:hypothetical protein
MPDIRHEEPLLTYRLDQEPLPERRLILRRPLPPLRLQGDSLLHCDFWCQSWFGPARTAHLGQGAGSAYRASQVDQPTGYTGPGRCINIQDCRPVWREVVEVTSSFISNNSNHWDTPIHSDMKYKRCKNGSVITSVLRNQKTRLDKRGGS